MKTFLKKLGIIALLLGAAFMTMAPSSVTVDRFTDLSDAPSSYSGQTGKCTKVNAGETALEFGACGGAGGSPGGSDTQIQFNDGGSFNGIAGFTLDKTNVVLTFGTSTKTNTIAWKGTTSGTLTLAPPVVAGANTLTFPAATDTLIGKDTTDTLTNKTLNSANNAIHADDAIALAADPANCASSGLAGGVTAAGVAEACVTPHAGTNIAADLEEEGQINATAVTGNVADTQLLIGTGASTAGWVTMSGEATISNLGVLTIADSVAVTNWNLTTPTITTSLTTSTPTTLSVAELDRLDGIDAALIDLNDSPILTGAWDFGGATSVELPNGTGVTVDAAGEVGVDTTDDQLVYYGAAKRVLGYKFQKCRFKNNVTSADDASPIGSFRQAVTITGVWCRYWGTGSTVATFTLQDSSGNAMTITGTNPTCVTTSASAAIAAVTGGNTLVAGEGLEFNTTNTPSPLTDDYEICVEGTKDAQ